MILVATIRDAIMIKGPVYLLMSKNSSTPSIPEIFFLVYVFTYGMDKIREVPICPTFFERINLN